ncbi:hypothetical protein A4G20_05550 [Pasteurellaceae bacterium RH1A]|nr:hypothetical protein A4G20_05550 [Pasteurellaceae bacterium RH1A]
MSQEQDRILRKIKKLLALGQSSNPFEAAKALEMAQKLMTENGLNQNDVVFSEHNGKAKFAIKTPRYVQLLAGVICKAFGVEAYFSNHYGGAGEDKMHMVFFGKDERPQVASYCFDVLYRQLQKARKDFNAQQSKRLKRTTQIARADHFCEGWVAGVNEVVKAFVSSPEEQEELERAYRQLSEKRQFNEAAVRKAGDGKERYGSESRLAGYEQGKQVQLNHGVNGKENVKLGVRND